jgi:hypothetical protein
VFARDFFGSDAWPFYRYNANRRRRFDLLLEGIEPAAKKSMPLEDKVAVQRVVTEQLAMLKRGPFRGPIALRLVFETSRSTPAHIQSIAKNFLDLLGRPRKAESNQSDQAVLYYDDSQVHALSVTCRHGEAAPSIRITAQSHRAFMQDLGIVSHVQRHLYEKRERESYRPHRLDDSIEEFAELVRDESSRRDWLGEASFRQWLALSQRDAQEALFTKTKIDLGLLAYLHGSPSPVVLRGYRIPTKPTNTFENLLQSFPMRISLPNLPRRPGESEAYRRVVEQALRTFRSKYSKLLIPLRIPAALEVFMKPPTGASPHTIHDLDNIVRNYLIPAIVRELKPFSSFEFSFRDSDSSGKGTSDTGLLKRRAPESTRFGVPRYEVWRLPRAECDASEGFVCLNFVYDLAGFDDTFSRLEREVEEASQAMWRRR